MSEAAVATPQMDSTMTAPHSTPNAPLDTMTVPNAGQNLSQIQHKQQQEARDFIHKAMNPAEANQTAPQTDAPQADQPSLYEQLEKAATDRANGVTPEETSETNQTNPDGTVSATKESAPQSTEMRNPLEDLVPSTGEDGKFDFVAAAASIATITDPVTRRLAEEGFRAQLMSMSQPAAQAQPATTPQAIQEVANVGAQAGQQDNGDAEYNNAVFSEFVRQFENGVSTHFGNVHTTPTLRLLQSAFEGKPVLYEAPANATAEQKAQVQRANQVVMNTVRTAREKAESKAEMSILKSRLASYETARSMSTGQQTEAQHRESAAKEVTNLLIHAVDTELKVPHILADNNKHREIAVSLVMKEYGKLMNDPKYSAHAATPQGRQKIMSGALFNTMKNFPAIAGVPANNGGIPNNSGSAQQINVDGAASASVIPIAAAKVSSPKTINPGGVDVPKANGQTNGSILGDDLNALDVFGPQGKARLQQLLKGRR